MSLREKSEKLKTHQSERHMDKEALMRVRAARQRMGEGKDIDMERHMGHGPIQWKKNF